MFRILSKIVLSIALCTASMSLAVSKNEVIKFRNQLSDLVSTVLALGKKVSKEGSLSTADSNLLTSACNDFSASSISLMNELKPELRMYPGKHSRLMHILQHELGKLADAMEAQNAKKVKKISEQIILQLNTIIKDEQYQYSMSTTSKKPSSTVFIAPILAGIFLGCVLSEDELYNCCCTLGKVFTGLAGYAAVVVAFDL